MEVNSVKGFAMFLNLKEFEDVGFFMYENFFIYFEEIDLLYTFEINNKIYLDKTIKIKSYAGVVLLMKRR